MRSSLLRFSVTAALLGTACFMSGPPSPPTTGTGFQPDSPATYVSKVKNLLTGEAATPDEIAQVASASDPQSALASLIDTWMTTAEYSNTMMAFFEIAFQQTQITMADFTQMIPVGQEGLGANTYVNYLVEDAKESFARTVLELIAEGKPFTDAFTTTRYMMTPPLMELYGFLDAAQPDDSDVFSGMTDQFRTQQPGVPIVVQDTTMIPLSDTLDPTNANYMNWYFPGAAALAKYAPVSGGNPACQLDTRTYMIAKTGSSSVNLSHVLHDLLYGNLDTYIIGQPPNCVAVGSPKNSIFQPADFTAWKMVTLHTPNDGSGAKPVRFYDAPTLQNPMTTDLVLSTPRLGFFTTPAFQANWQTNTSNEMRVTMNQTFIVALGAQVDGTDATNPGPNPPGLDQAHVQAGPACLGCHQTLDPSRSIFQATYSYGYGQQRDTTLTPVTGEFAFQGIINKSIASITDLGTTLVSHPLVGPAWVQKLCYYATSQACAADDPLYQAIVADFQKGFSWPTLVRELFSSPIVTNASETKTYDEIGSVVSVSRSDHLCTTLSNRLGLTDVCALVAPVPPTTGVPLISPGLPSDGYGRGAPVPVLPTQPTLFYRAGIENICEDLSAIVVDNPKPPAGAKAYSSASQDTINAAIADFVSNLMGLDPTDPRTAQVTPLLQSHYAAAAATAGASPTQALQSTFIVACSSPSVTGIGM